VPFLVKADIFCSNGEILSYLSRREVKAMLSQPFEIIAVFAMFELGMEIAQDNHTLTYCFHLIFELKE